jgi:hypothetical protein
MDEPLRVHREATRIYRFRPDNPTTTDDQIYLENIAVFDRNDDDDESVADTIPDRDIFDRKKNPSLEVIAAYRDRLLRARRPAARTSVPVQLSEVAAEALQTSVPPSQQALPSDHLKQGVPPQQAAPTTALNLQTIATEPIPQLQAAWKQYVTAIGQLYEAMISAIVRYIRTQPAWQAHNNIESRAHAKAAINGERGILDNWVQKNKGIPLRIDSNITKADQLSMMKADFAIDSLVPETSTDPEMVRHAMTLQVAGMAKQISWTRSRTAYWTQEAELAEKALQAARTVATMDVKETTGS